ncbi:MAG TPA: 3-dehydroquinate synthase family protein [Acidimicrobiales bacterium]|nr:3-dehydroquinate synthase family protein [Acidimicrobiales bacterium]
MRTVPVELGDRRYEVFVGPGVRHQLADRVAEVTPDASRVAVVTQPGIGVSVDPGTATTVFELPEGEAAKSLSVVEELCRDFARAGVSRSDLVVAVGGGVVTDVAGFAAATFHRGTPYVNVATTLLGQVDAAIGGKTGVNLEEGKNLVGAFWQPKAVLCDTELLTSLPPREWASGRGEMAKYALLSDSVDGEIPSGTGLLDLPLAEQVACCAAVKAGVVAADELEGGRRAILNYGHTLAHALEASAFDPGAHSDLRHGEAVAVGLVFAALLARRLGRIDEDRVELHRRVVGGFDLSWRLPAGADPERLVAFMTRDKKARHDLTFVLDGPNGVEPVHGIGPADVVATLAEMERTGRDGRG